MSQALEPITVTATEANRRFSALLREVAAGRTVLITSRGKVVARMQTDGVGKGPSMAGLEAERERRRKEGFEALERLWAAADARENPPPPWTWNREELYEDEL